MQHFFQIKNNEFIKILVHKKPFNKSEYKKCIHLMDTFQAIFS